MGIRAEKTTVVATRLKCSEAEAMYQYARKTNTTVADMIREGLAKIVDFPLTDVRTLSDKRILK